MACCTQRAGDPQHRQATRPLRSATIAINGTHADTAATELATAAELATALGHALERAQTVITYQGYTTGLGSLHETQTTPRPEQPTSGPTR